MSRFVLRSAAVTLILASLLTGCDGLTGLTVETSTPGPAPRCAGWNESVDGPPLTVATLLPVTTSIVIATARTTEAGRWNTTTGLRPEEPGLGGPRSMPRIMTPVNLDVLEAIVGPAGPGAMQVLIQGGTAGCDVYTVSPAPAVEIGQTYAVFLQPSRDADMGPRPDLPQIIAAWPVAADGTVMSEHDGELSGEAFRALIANPEHPITPVPATPAGTDNPG